MKFALHSFSRSSLWLMLAMSYLATGCSSQPANSRPKSGEPLNVLTTTAMVADVVRGVGGEHVRVTTLLGPGVDPHLYKTTRDDVASIMNADVVFYSGLMLEGKMGDMLDKVGKQKPVHAVTESIPHDQLLSDSEQSGHPDPHVWFDVALWGQTADRVATVLGEVLPQHADEFVAAAKTYQDQLASLHELAKESIATIPKSQRILITSHDAFGYFGRAYDIEVMGVQGISTDSEAGLQRVNELVDLIVEKQVPSVFVESSVPQKSIQALIEGARSRGHEVTVGGELFSDAAGEPGTLAGTYPGMIRHNTETITKALGGEWKTP